MVRFKDAVASLLHAVGWQKYFARHTFHNKFGEYFIAIKNDACVHGMMETTKSCILVPKIYNEEYDAKLVRCECRWKK